MKTLKELLDARLAKQTELDNILAVAKKEGRDDKTLNDTESARCDTLLDEIEQLDVAIKEKRAAASDARATRLELSDARRAPAATSVTPPRGPEVPSDDRSDPVTHTNQQKYSLLRAIRCLIERRPVDGYEGEISQEMAQRSGKVPTGFYMPLGLQVGHEQRAFDVTAGAGGLQHMVAPTVIDALRTKPLLTRLGATVLTGMVGTFDLPKMTGTGTAYWVGEATAPTTSSQALGQVEFTPSTLGAYTDITRRLVNQVSFDSELLVRNDLTQVVAVEMDRAGFNGSGASNQPTGILQDGGVGTVAIGTNGGAPTWAKLVELESVVAVDNADDGTIGYVTSNYGRGKLKTTEKGSAGYPVYLWGDDDRVNGYRANATNQIPSNLTKGSGTDLTAVIYGDFSTCVFAFWTGLDVTVDPYSLSTSGGIRVVVLVDTTFKLRQAQRLRKIVDMTR